MIKEAGAKQNTVNVNITVSKDSVFEIRDANGNTVISRKAAGAYYAIAYSSEKLKTGETYYVYIDGEQKDSFTVDSLVTTVGTQSNMPFGGGRGMISGQVQNRN